MTEFRPDRQTYIQSHLTLAAVAMAGGMLILWIAGNPHVWTGAIGGLAAVAIRGWYLMDEALGEAWTMDETTLNGPGGRIVRLSDLANVKKIGSAVQLITKSGDKHLIKFQGDPEGVVARIKR
ncbi:hypothetical protein [Pacificoceanicola onchidii]|uniref:hypothetical protein n=1 Tax=Pacificoceanicola onchidii TaxID=2562685 RepID=UPI0010A30F26|nr:hypothetical protein [Pacificoceanicola onchidii]